MWLCLSLSLEPSFPLGTQALAPVGAPEGGVHTGASAWPRSHSPPFLTFCTSDVIPCRHTDLSPVQLCGLPQGVASPADGRWTCGWRPAHPQRRLPRRLSRVQLVCGSSQAELLVAGRALTCLRIWLEYRFARAFGVRPETPLPNRPRHAWSGVRAQCWVAVLQTRRVAVSVRDAPAVWASGA